MYTVLAEAVLHRLDASVEVMAQILADLFPQSGVEQLPACGPQLRRLRYCGVRLLEGRVHLSHSRSDRQTILVLEGVVQELLVLGPTYAERIVDLPIERRVHVDIEASVRCISRRHNVVTNKVSARELHGDWKADVDFQIAVDDPAARPHHDSGHQLLS